MLRRNANVLKQNIPDLIVFGEIGHEMKALMTAQALVKQGEIVENSVFNNIDNVKEYAKNKGIKQICVVGDDVKTINIQGGVENE